jgi:APA family basic amino acid/polyamine antiporter
VTFKRALGPFDATMVVIGGIIGSGIFINPYIVAQRLDSTSLVLGAWAAGGAIALVGALAYAELGAIAPRAGGQYVYLRDAYHPLAGFLYGWALLAVIETGAIAAVAITFATYALRLVGQPQAPAVPLAIAALIVLSGINYLGVKPGSRVLNVLVVLKVAALGALIAFGAFAAGHAGWWAASRPSPGGGATMIAFGFALVPILFAYGGWQNANYLAEEIENPRRNLPLSLIAGTVAVIAIYSLVNVVYLRAMGLDGLAATTTPAADAARRMFGTAGDQFVTAAIAISTFGFLDLAILAPTRVYYAMAADGLFLPALARLHPRYGTPGTANRAADCMVVRARAQRHVRAAPQLRRVRGLDLLRMTVATVLIFRRTRPLDERPPDTFRMPAYPVLPVLFALTAVCVVGSVIWSDPGSAVRGALLLAAGIPIFYWFRSSQRRPQV